MVGLLYLAVAAAMLAAGAEAFAENATAAGRRLGVTTLAVGLVLAGAEPEELLTAVVAAVRHRPDIAVGDAVGANVTMLTLVLGLAALLAPLALGRRVRRYAAGAAVVALLAALALVSGRLTRVEGGLLVAAYVVLVAAVWRLERRPPSFGELADDDGSAARRPAVALGFVVGGIALMTLGGRVAVAGAERTAEALGRSDSAVGLTLVALATTAELLALVWAAARHDVTEVALAGVVGSAAYNATVTLGAAALVRPSHPAGAVVVAAFAAVVLLAGLACWPRERLPRWAGAVLVAAYLAFVITVLA